MESRTEAMGSELTDGGSCSARTHGAMSSSATAAPADITTRASPVNVETRTKQEIYKWCYFYYTWD